MKGLEISKAYFEEYGRPMLMEQFPELMPYLAAGLCGSGSECLGYDDDVSTDHDYEPGFIIFLPGEDVVDRQTSFKLERAYAKLPKEYMGLKKSLMQPVGGARRGVIRTEEFFSEKCGRGDGNLSYDEWIRTPEYALLEAVNGEIFFDNYGEVTAIREKLSYLPEDIRKKKLAGNLLLMAQSGQYNYMRCISHGEEGAAQLAVAEYVKAAMSVAFMLNKKYQPYYKWSFRAMRELEKLSIDAELLEYLITTPNDGDMTEEKYRVIEGIASDYIDVLIDEGITKAICGDLEKHAYSVNDGIEDPELRNMHILSAI